MSEIDCFFISSISSRNLADDCFRVFQRQFVVGLTNEDAIEHRAVGEQQRVRCN